MPLDTNPSQIELNQLKIVENIFNEHCTSLIKYNFVKKNSFSEEYSMKYTNEEINCEETRNDTLLLKGIIRLKFVTKDK